MEPQLRFPEPAESAECADRANPAGSDWRLDERTRLQGRAGVAAARRALAVARRPRAA
ncbi:MAG: hypothetical protein ABIW46_05595 [Acidimicrobiales bacterium]